MICRLPPLSEHQSISFERFLQSGTGKVLKAFENMFELEIERSESLMEIARAHDSEALRDVVADPLYAVSSDLSGELRGRVHLLLQTGDLNDLAELLKPVLSLLFLSSPDADLKTLDNARPGWMEDLGMPAMDDACFQAQMMDALSELGNVLIGIYSRLIHDLSALGTRRSLPRVEYVADPKAVPLNFHGVGTGDVPLMIIDHLIQVDGAPIHLWCVISFAPDSFQDLLRGIDTRTGPAAPSDITVNFLQQAASA